MKTNRLNLWLAAWLLVAAGCGGARTPLDELVSEQPGGSTGGGGTAQAGDTGLGGSLATGGAVGTAGQTGFAGATANTGGFIAGGGTGGFVSFGGNTGFGGNSGGRGGTISSGGTLPLGGSVVGGRGGSVSSGGTLPLGGSVVGGRGGSVSSGGTLPLGGSVVGGRGGSVSSGGTLPLGGSVVGGRGGSVSSGGTLPLGGSVVGGRGGSAGAGGASATAGATCPGVEPNQDLIDDMNDGDRYIPQVHGRAGAWKDADDGTPGATMFPDPAGPFTMTWTGDACRQYAAYVYGGPFVDSGASFGFGLGSPYDAGAYFGFTFWARIDGGTSARLRVTFPDKDTKPDGGLCQAGITGNLCWDHYGQWITLTPTWTQYTIYFTSLTQDGWGRAGAGFDSSTIYEVLFEIGPNGKFGIWIDDVAFFYVVR